MTDPSSPILLLDTGVGGLTVLKALREIMPTAPVIFAADMAGMPYGEKSEAEVAARVAGLLGRMSERYRPRLACIACNTASTIALGMVREVLEIPIVGTVPAIKPAALASKTGVIGLLGTQATVRQPYVDRLEAEFINGGQLLRHAAPGLVDEAEKLMRGDDVDRGVLRAALQGLRDQPQGDQIDQIVMGCTHFPMLNAHMRDIAVQDLGWDVSPAFVDGAQGIARRIAHLTQGKDFAQSTPSRAVTTGEIRALQQLQSVFRGFGIDQLERF